MSATNRLKLGAALFAALAVAGCAADTTTGPSVEPGARLSSLGLAGNADVIARTRPLFQDYAAMAVIGRAGGKLELPDAGLTLEVPAGAVAAPTTFTVTALGGDMVAYEFGPHGTHFALPLRVTQRTTGLDVAGLSSGTLLAGYFPDRTRLDAFRRRAELDELLPATLDLSAGTITFQVRHFSGYLVSSGNIKKPKGDAVGGSDGEDSEEDGPRSFGGNGSN